MKPRLLTVAVILPLTAAACSDCNILSSNMPLHCEAGLVAGMILVAPVAIPLVLIEEANAGG